MPFIHLHNHSHYSMLDGLAKPEDMIKRAKHFGMNALALTDHGNLYGAIEFYKAALKEGIKPIMGIEAYLAPRSRFDKNGLDDKYFHITLLAQNNRGWLNLLQLITRSHFEGFYYKPRIDKELLKEFNDGIIALSGCPSGELARLFLRDKDDQAREALKQYLDIFGERFYIEIWHQEKIPEVMVAVPKLIALAKEYTVPLVATQDMHYLRKEDSFYHDVLLAVQTGNKITDDDRLTLRAGDFSMRSPEEMTELFKDVPEAIENTQRIADLCNVEIPLGKTILPEFVIPTGETKITYLKRLIDQRIGQRYSVITQEIKDRLNYELSVIEKTGFIDYFLIVQDFVNWAKERKIAVGPGRGSAAGSIISYILKITDVDPIQYNLLFERFLNPDRIQMPDIDIDFTDARRDEVIGYLQDTYGKESVAQIITFGTMASRAAIRDTGRALGFSYGFCDQIAKLIPFNNSLQEALEHVEELKKLYDSNSDARKLIDSAKHLEGVVRHASVHACGTVISKGSLTQYMPLQFAPQDTNTIITQFEGNSVEAVGILKMDLLGLKNLTIIEDTLRLVKDAYTIDIDISTIPLDDQAVFELLQAGNTTGVFQLESSGMRRYLKELKPTELEDIIAMVALYRPGPIELIPQYIARKHGREQVEYLHPSLEPILKKTYGIGVYQEQMMHIARDIAGFTLGQADTLRKAIGKKIKELLDEQKEKLIAGMIENGLDKKTAKAIWELFPPFARYGFNRSHAVCYAFIAYRTAYLKAHYPIEFGVSLFNADAGDIDRIAFLVDEAKKMNIPVLPPDINQSYARFTADGNAIRFGLGAIKNVGGGIVDAIIQERQRRGPFTTFKDFLARIIHKDLNRKSIESLAKSGAFDSLEIERNAILSNMDTILACSQQLKKHAQTSQHNLFGAITNGMQLTLSKSSPATDDQKLLWERELLGFYISGHPVQKYAPLFRQKRTTPIKELILSATASGKSVRVGGVITTIKKIISKNNKPVLFAKIEDMADTIEVVVFSETLERKPDVWTEGSVVIAQGKTSPRDGEQKIIVDQVIKLN